MGYEKRFVAFLDILGFSTHIDETVKNANSFQRVKKALDILSTVSSELLEHCIGKEVTIFSDSIIISYAANLPNGDALFQILIDLIHICIEVSAYDIYMRGGATYGSLYHKGVQCFGPAMVRAYELENKKAIYPRIVIDEEAIIRDLELANTSTTNNAKWEFEDTKELMLCDKDGTWYLDIFSQHQEFNDFETYIDFLFNTRKDLIYKLTTLTDSYVLVKFKWLANEFNRQLCKVFTTKQGKKLKNELHINILEA